MMQPVGRKILVQPIEPEDVSEGGIILVRDGREPDTLGRIVQIGPQAGRRWAEGVTALREVVSTAMALTDNTDLADRAQWVWHGTAGLVPEVEFHVGQTVILPPDRGHEIVLDGVRYLLVQDEDILAVLDDELEDVTHG
jgi:co-chaperonin GroES (HSP10)